ncbi:MAG: hypothetical protein ACYSUC_04315 [Planctomycetota bacterium]
MWLRRSFPSARRNLRRRPFVPTGIDCLRELVWKIIKKAASWEDSRKIPGIAQAEHSADQPGQSDYISDESSATV